MKRDLNAILTVLANGYEANISINGKDIGIKGLKSESVKLFGIENPVPPVLPEDMKQQICLEEGDNSILIRIKRISDAPPEAFTLELQAREQFVNGATLYSKKEKLSVGEEKEFSDIVTL
jgi:hypothetical protein